MSKLALSLGVLFLTFVLASTTFGVVAQEGSSTSTPPTTTTSSSSSTTTTSSSPANTTTTTSSASSSPTGSPTSDPPPTTSAAPSYSYSGTASPAPYPSGSDCPPDQKCGGYPTGSPTCPPGAQDCFGGGQSGPPPECQEKMQAIGPRLQSLNQEHQDKVQAFQGRFEADRKNFAQTTHTKEEWEAWSQKWRTEQEAIDKEYQQKRQEIVQSLGPCAQYMPPEPMPGMGGGPGGPSGPGGGPADYKETYGTAPPQGDKYYEEDQAVAEIRARCEAQMRQIMSSFQQSKPSTSPDGKSGAMQVPPEMHARMQELMKKCEAEVRAHYKDFREKEGEPQKREDEFGSFQMYFDEENHQITVSGKFLSMKGNPDSQVMSDVSCGGQEFLDQIFANGYLENFQPEQTEEGTALHIEAGGSRVISIHDNPRCVINVAANDKIPQFTFDLSDYLEVKKGDNGYSFSDGEVDGKILIHSGASEFGASNTITIKGKATFLVSNAATSAKTDLNVKKALEDGNIGAEVIVAQDDGKLKSDTTPYGDLDVAVSKEGKKKVSATINSGSSEGKTIVMAFDGDIFNTIKLKVGIYAGEGADSGTEEACVQEADDLQDALDPNDDGACHEYWIVQDKNGVQALVSIYHFSKKRVEIESVGTSALGPIPGFQTFVALAALAAALGVVLVRTRRGA